MMNIIIAQYYQSNSAATNRITAFAKALADLGVSITIVWANTVDFEPPVIDNVVIDKCVYNKHILYFKVAKHIKDIYTENTVIYEYGSSILRLFLPSNKYKFFFEFTEIPFYGRSKTLVARIKEACKIILVKRSSGIFVISKALKEYYLSHGVKNVNVLNMFVDFSRFEKVGQMINQEKYIAYCGKISEFKDGVDCLIKAFDVFFAIHKDYCLKLIGGFESYSDEIKLKRLTDSLDCRTAVMFTGKVSSDDLPVLLQNARILALARPNNEQAKYGFPNKLGEYLATGKPVVVTKVGEIDNFLTDSVNCYLSKPDDPLSFAEKLIYVENNYDEALKVGQSGRECARKYFSSDTQAKYALEVITECINS